MNLLREAICVAPSLCSRLLKLANKEFLCGAEILSEFEQVLLPQNQVEPGRETDVLGVPRVRMYWNKSETELRAHWSPRGCSVRH